MSIRIKKRSKIYKIIEDCELLDRLFFGYLINDYKSLLLLDKIIHHALIGRIRSNFRLMVNSFVLCHSDLLVLLPEPKVNEMLKLWKTEKGDLNLMFTLNFHVGAKLKEESGYNFCLSHQIRRKNKLQNYVWNSQFYLSNNKNHSLWIYQEKHAKQSEQQSPTYSMDVPEVRKGDILSLSIPFFTSGQKVINLKFYPLELIPNLKTYCQLEDLHKWKKISNQGEINLEEDVSKGMFKKISHLYSVIGSNERIEYKCCEAGKQASLLKICFESYPSDSNIKVKLKKRGCYDDCRNRLMVREGDKVIVYLVKP